MLDLILLCAGLAYFAPQAWQPDPLATAPAAGRSAPAHLRPALPLAADVDRFFEVGSGGDLSVALFADADLPSRTQVRVSDGRGLSWSEPLSLDVDPTLRLGTAIDGVQVVGECIYLLWSEYDYAVESELYFACSRDAGFSWSVPARLDDGFPRGAGYPQEFQLAVAPDEAGDHVYVLTRTYPTSTLFPRELFLVASHDGGASFGRAQAVSSAGGRGFDVNTARMVVDGLRVDVVWTDDRTSPVVRYDEVYHRSSVDGGSSWTGVERLLSRNHAGTACVGARLAVSGDDVLVLWRESEVQLGPARVRAARSEDGGGSFTPDVEIGGFPADDRADTLELGTDGGGALLAVWARSDFFGTQSVIESSRSLDGGVTWERAVALPLAAKGLDRLRIAGSGEDVGVSYLSTPDGLMISSAFSTDFGRSWRQGAASTPAPFPTAAASPLAFNQRYRNYVRLTSTVEGGERELLVDGYRPQTLELVALAGGEGSFSFEGFTGEFPQVFVLASEAPGDFPLPTDDRNLGLHPGPLLQTTIHGVDDFDTTLDPAGRGVTRPRPFAALAGISLTFVAVAYDPNHFAFGSLTDAIELRFP